MSPLILLAQYRYVPPFWLVHFPCILIGPLAWFVIGCTGNTGRGESPSAKARPAGWPLVHCIPLQISLYSYWSTGLICYWLYWQHRTRWKPQRQSPASWLAGPPFLFADIPVFLLVHWADLLLATGTGRGESPSARARPAGGPAPRCHHHGAHRPREDQSPRLSQASSYGLVKIRILGLILARRALLVSFADRDPGSGAFLSPWSGMLPIFRESVLTMLKFFVNYKI